MNLVPPSRPRERTPARASDLNLDELRRGIDAIDDRIVALLDARADLARHVANVKAEGNLRVYDPEREQRVMDRLTARAKSFPSESIRAVYRQVMQACRAVQEERHGRTKLQA